MPSRARQRTECTAPSCAPSATCEGFSERPRVFLNRKLPLVVLSPLLHAHLGSGDSSLGTQRYSYQPTRPGRLKGAAYSSRNKLYRDLYRAPKRPPVICHDHTRL
jgi:hypothetical protein